MREKKNKQSKKSISRWAIWIVAFTAIILYANTLFNGFALDDEIVLTGNQYTQEGFSGISKILEYDSFRGYFREEGKSDLVAGGRYRPLSLVFFAILYEIAGLTPAVYHFINILFYAGLCCLVFKIGQRLFPKGPWTPLLIALLFTVHPVHSEVVANIKGLDEILALMGGLAALYLVLLYLEKKQLLWLILAAVSLFMALLSKENAITFLMAIPMVCWLFRKENRAILPRVFGVLLIPCLLFIGIRYQVLGNSFAAEPLELMNNPFVKIQDGQYVHMAYFERLGMIFYTYWEYMRLLFFPLRLSHDYYPMVVPNGWTLFSIVGCILCAGSLVWGIWSFLKEKKYAVGLLFFLGALFLVSNILFPIGTNMAERFLFMPTWGFSMFLIPFLKEKIGLSQLKIIMIAVFVLFSIRTMMRNTVWKDNKTLFLTDIETVPNSAKLNNAVGGVLLEDINGLNSQQDIDVVCNKAIDYLQNAIRLHPNYTNSYLLLGNAHLHKQEFAKSIEYYNQILAINPQHQDALNNKAIAYRYWGKYKGEKEGKLNEAIQYLTRSYEIKDSAVETVRLLGVAYGNSGDQQKAAFYFKRATELAPNNAAAWRDYSVVLRYLNQTEAAEAAYQKAISLNPDIFSK